MIWTDRHGHEWDLEARTPCQQCGQKNPSAFDTACTRDGNPDPPTRLSAADIARAMEAISEKHA